jgi:hypothetical protein
VGAELDQPERYDPLITMPAGAAAATTTGGGGPTCDLDAAMLTCQGVICHGSPGVASALTLGAGLDLFTADRDTALLNAPATYAGVADPEMCPTSPELLIDAANPDASLLLTKLNNTYSCGASMPVTQVEKFTSVELECVTAWVHFVAGGAAAASVIGAAQGAGNGGSSSF